MKLLAEKLMTHCSATANSGDRYFLSHPLALPLLLCPSLLAGPPSFHPTFLVFYHTVLLLLNEAQRSPS